MDLNRRRFVAGTGALITASALAGCPDDDDAPDDAPGDANGAGPGDEDAAPGDEDAAPGDDETPGEEETPTPEDGDDETPGDDEANGENGDPEEQVDTFLTENDALLYEGDVEDVTGEDEVTVDVGAGDDGFAFDPPAIRIDAGTTVVWEWTGEGGGHNVVPDEESELQDFGDEEIVDEEGHTVEDTFDESGAALYNCEPHRGVGMLGGIVVE